MNEERIRAAVDYVMRELSLSTEYRIEAAMGAPAGGEAFQIRLIDSKDDSRAVVVNLEGTDGEDSVRERIRTQLETFVEIDRAT